MSSTSFAHRSPKQNTVLRNRHGRRNLSNRECCDDRVNSATPSGAVLIGQDSMPTMAPTGLWRSGWPKTRASSSTPASGLQLLRRREIRAHQILCRTTTVATSCPDRPSTISASWLANGRYRWGSIISPRNPEHTTFRNSRLTSTDEEGCAQQQRRLAAKEVR